MPAKRTYTDEQLDYIKRYWRKYPTKLVAEQLSMTPARVNSIASRLGLTKNKNKARAPLPEFITPPFDEWVEGKVYNIETITLDIPPRREVLTSRKNWLQRLVSWFLTGEA